MFEFIYQVHEYPFLKENVTHQYYMMQNLINYLVKFHNFLQLLKINSHGMAIKIKFKNEIQLKK